MYSKSDISSCTVLLGTVLSYCKGTLGLSAQCPREVSRDAGTQCSMPLVPWGFETLSTESRAPSIYLEHGVWGIEH